MKIDLVALAKECPDMIISVRPEEDFGWGVIFI